MINYIRLLNILSLVAAHEFAGNSLVDVENMAEEELTVYEVQHGFLEIKILEFIADKRPPAPRINAALHYGL